MVGARIFSSRDAGRGRWMGDLCGECGGDGAEADEANLRTGDHLRTGDGLAMGGTVRSTVVSGGGCKLSKERRSSLVLPSSWAHALSSARDTRATPRRLYKIVHVKREGERDGE